MDEAIRDDTKYLGLHPSGRSSKQFRTEEDLQEFVTRNEDWVVFQRMTIEWKDITVSKQVRVPVIPR